MPSTIENRIRKLKGWIQLTQVNLAISASIHGSLTFAFSSSFWTENLKSIQNFRQSFDISLCTPGTDGVKGQ